jgi:CrcB protein
MIPRNESGESRNTSSEAACMRNLFIIGMGGFCGAILRYMVSGGIQRWSQSVDFPFGTLAVNLIGCLIIGMLSRLDEVRSVLSPEMRFFIMIGLLGAFTTYSTFSNEAMNLINDQRFQSALLYVGTHVVLGLAAVLLGRISTYLIWR